MDATDDRVLRTTRVVSAVIIPVLTAAFVILYLFPDRTADLWAWTINQEMTVMLMGGGYLAGAYLFVRALFSSEWHRIGVAFVAITVFTTLLGLATFLHWNRFNHDHVSFWAWLALYIITPVLLPVLWLRNRRFDPRVPEASDRVVPMPVRTAMVAFGAGQLALAAALFIWPSLFLDRWPWPLTPLTARTVSGFVAFPAVAYLAFAFDSRWSSFEVPIETATIGLALIGVAGLRAADEFRGGDVLVWGWRIGLVVGLALLLTLRLTMGRPARATEP